jgi:hypothetical protein
MPWNLDNDPLAGADYVSDSDRNPHYNPENCGLELVADIELDNESYQFNLVVVWRDIKTGALYMGRDSGCSCPSPFEDVHGLEDLERLDFTALETDVKSYLPLPAEERRAREAAGEYIPAYGHRADPAEVDAFLAAVKDAALNSSLHVPGIVRPAMAAARDVLARL